MEYKYKFKEADMKEEGKILAAFLLED